MAEDNSADLTDINGVGPSTADSLRDAGLETATDVAQSSEDELEDALDGLAVSTEAIQENAQEATEGPADNIIDEIEADLDAELDEELEDLEAELEAEDEDDDQERDVSVDDGELYHPVEFEASGTVGLHVINSVLQEAVRMRQRNRFDDEETLHDVAYQLMRDIVDTNRNPNDVESTTFQFDVTQRDLDYVHQAVSAGMSNYRGKSGLPNLWSDISQVLDQLDEARSDVRE